jgi:hypothetical protein
VGLLAIWLALSALEVCAQDLPGQEFTVIALPDTQIMSRDYPQIFAAQTKWIADNTESMNIRMVLGLGDIVDDAESIAQWQNADAAIRNLDGKVPYALALGNHDYNNESPSSRTATNYNQYFGKMRYAGYSYYRGGFSSTTNENFWAEFTANGHNYIVLVLDFHPRDAVLDWAKSILAAHPGRPVILVTHAYTYSDDTRIDQCDTNDMTASKGNDGELIWEKFVRDSAATIVVSGHITSGGPGRSTDVATPGQAVHQMMSNYQGSPLGGGGFLRILHFKPLEGIIEVKTYSPWSNSFKTDGENQFTLALNADPTLTTGTLSGRVRATNCTAIGGATVTAGTASATTDSGGYFSLSVPTGSHSVTVEKSGWQTQSKTADVKPGYGVHQDYYLTAESTSCPAGATDPSVHICAPTNGATVSSPVNVVATARSSKGVSYMQVYVDGTKVYQVSSSTLNTNLTMAAGARRVTVQAKDTAGMIFKQAININVSSTQPPPVGCTAPTTNLTVNICTPTNGASVSSPVHVTAKATSSAGVSLMQIYVDGIKAYQASGSSVDTNVTMSAGTRRLTVQARDNAGTTFKKTIFMTVSGGGTQPPPTSTCTMSSTDHTVTICQPADGASVASPVRVVAGTTSSVPVSYMQIYVDGIRIYHVNANKLDTTVTMSAGTRRVTVQAKDANGLLFKKTLFISVTP